MSRAQSRGNCVFCGREFAKGGLSRHLPTCAKRLEAQTEADHSKRRRQALYHLQVQDAWKGDFWLHLEMRGEATLQELDDYLRAIWLECCGHLSAFEIGEIRYTQVFEDGMSLGEEQPLTVRVREVFVPGMEIPYEYDFGSTTELVVKVVSERQGRPTTSHPIVLMARNKLEPMRCLVCGQPAAWLCLQCMYDREDEACQFCEEHIYEHMDEESHNDYGGPMPIVNSPRTGMCGYSGPAEPPY